jgi:branched-chain amino acid transport system substrate-binding protein
MKIRIRIIVGILLLALLLSSCGQAQPQAIQTEEVSKTIKIGVPTLMTGWGAPMGADIMAGIGMAVEKVNAEGGVLGKQLEIVYADTKNTTAEDCALAAQSLDQAGVVAFFPGAFYGPACAIEFANYKQPLMHGTASAEVVDPIAENLEEYGNVFQVSASEEAFGPNAFTTMTSLPYDYPNKKVALLGGDISYDMLIKDGIAKLAEENGWEIVMNDTYPYGTTEFGAQLAKIRIEEPAIIFGCITSVDSAVAFTNQFLQNPTNSLIFIQWAPVASEFIQLLGEKSEGLLWQTEYAYLPTQDNFNWAADFKAEFGREPGAAWPAMMDDMLYIWIDAVNSVGSATDYDGIDNYIRTLSDHPYEGRVGRYGMNPARNEGLTGTDWIPIHLYQIQDQKNVLLFLGTEPFQGTDAVAAGEFVVPPWIQ